MKKIIFILLIFVSCSKEENPISNGEVNYIFVDSFETNENNLMELFTNFAKQ